MQNSITLTQLPYTGFDYGEMYNSLFWVALFVWSLVVAGIVLYNKASFARMFSGLAKVFIVEREVQGTEPVVLQERVINFDPLVDPIAASMHNKSGGSTQTDIQKDVIRAVDSITRVTEASKVSPEVATRVQGLVDKELAVSRVGQTPDEFSSDDFGTVDFDGVNPDDAWKPREEIVIQPVQVPTPQQEVVKQKSTAAEPIREEVKVAPIQRQIMPKPNTSKVFTDTITLDTSDEYPKVVLTREDTTNY